jgi:hypothetical protein
MFPRYRIVRRKPFKIRNNEAKGTSVVGHCCWKVGLSRGRRRAECKSRAGTKQAAVVNAAPRYLTQPLAITSVLTPLDLLTALRIMTI